MMETYVDDADLWQTSNTIPRGMTPVQSLQQLAQKWYDLLEGTGGTLGNNKCGFSRIDFEWENGRYSYTENTEEKLYLQTREGPVEIKQVSATTGTREVGIGLAPDGNTRDEFKYRMAQARTAKSNIMAAPFNKYEAKIAHDRFWWPAIGWPLPVTTFTKEECNKIQQKFQSAFINKMGYNKRTPRAIRYGPKKYGGKALFTTWHEQGIGQVELCIKHLRKEDDLAEYIHTSRTHLQLESGLGTPVLLGGYKFVKQYTTKCFLKSMWAYLDDNDLKMFIPDKWLPLKHRTGDSHIMELAKDQKYGTAKLRQVQMCRIYLKVTTMSDITDTEGRCILRKVWKGESPPDRTPIFNYANQGQPPPTAWTTFRNLLRTTMSNVQDHVLENR